MKNILMIPLVFGAMVSVACGGDGARRGDQKSYETVQEGSASGVTSTIHGPGEVLPPLTGTNSDTTTAFTIDPNGVGTSPAPLPPNAVAGAPMTTGATSPAYPPPQTSAAPAPQPAPARPSANPPAQPQPVAPQPRPQPAPEREPEPEPLPPPTATVPPTQTDTAPPPTQTDTVAPPEKPEEEEPPPPTTTDTRGEGREDSEGDDGTDGTDRTD